MARDFEKIDDALVQILADLRVVRSSQDRMEEWFGNHGYGKRGSGQNLPKVPPSEPGKRGSGQNLPKVSPSEPGAAQQTPLIGSSPGRADVGESTIHHGAHVNASIQEDPVVWESGAVFTIESSELPSPFCHPLKSLTVAFADDSGAKYLKPKRKPSKEDILNNRQDTRISTGSKRVSGMHKHRGAMNCFQKIVYHRYFEPTSAFIIMFHTTFLAFYVESLAAYNGKPPAAWPVCNQVLVGVFFVEVILKMLAEKLEYFCDSERIWNIFDLILIIMVTIEIFVTIVTSSLDEHRKVVKKMLKMGEVLRTFRVLRIFRVLRFSHSLSTVISKIFNSIKTLFWVMVLIMMLIFVVAVCFTNGATHYLDDTEIADVHRVRDNFGSVPRSFLTVFKSVSGGMRWGDAADSLQAMNDFYFSMFLAFIAFTMFAVLNIMTGIFVDAALQTASTERDLIMEKQHELERESVEHLREVFFDIDEEENGLIMLDQFKKSLSDDRVKAFLHSLKINTSDAKQLFRLLDSDNSGEILIDEFVEGCMKIRGEAKSMDIHILMCESRRMWTKFALFSEQLSESIYEMSRAVSEKHSMPARTPPFAPSLYGSRVGSRVGSRAGSVVAVSRRPSDLNMTRTSTLIRTPDQNTGSLVQLPPHSPPSLPTVGAKDSPESKELLGSAQPEVETTGIVPINTVFGPHGSDDNMGQSTDQKKPSHSPTTVPAPAVHPFGLQLDSDLCTKILPIE